jgi:hypothetical protein
MLRRDTLKHVFENSCWQFPNLQGNLAFALTVCMNVIFMHSAHFTNTHSTTWNIRCDNIVTIRRSSEAVTNNLAPLVWLVAYISPFHDYINETSAHFVRCAHNWIWGSEERSSPYQYHSYTDTTFSPQEYQYASQCFTSPAELRGEWR